MTLIQDLIDIPERVQKGDFVLRLAEDVQRPEVVLHDYVVTPELCTCFEAALSLIRSAVQGRTSKATYLHGSFGTGKSHFMAILHLILAGNADARSIAELASIIQKHNAWMAGKRFLLVPYHMINAHDMESGVLGGYVEYMRRTRPDAPIPAVYMSAAIIKQARAERASYGDEAFFRRLNAGQPGGGQGWGDLEAAWDADSFEAAAASPPDSETHLRLVSTLLKTVATSHADVISSRGGSFVRFDAGLSIISQHAKALGYDALILFLDELILWLAMNSADLGFIKREAAKLTNLVEAQAADRPVPIVSFVARQRDLRELIGEHVPGAERLSFGDSLDWQGGRFDTITLEDRNLPAIAEKRVLRCKDAAARRELDLSFKQATQASRMKDHVLSILLTHEGDREMFRRLYPFSPALVQTLIAVSSVLQRERTALKVMMQLLVEQRDTLKVGDVIPVGDLFDVIAYGEEAFSQEMAIHFDNATRLYQQKLLPAIEKQHGIRREDVLKLPYDDPRRIAFRNDDRLVKTLLLSALVPEVESLRGLNAERLAALNHGSIKAVVPGREAQEVLRRCRDWARTVGEIRIGEEVNPTITVQLSGVDTESIVAQADREDNQGNRIRRVRQMLFEQLGIEGDGDFEQYHEFTWRNTRRSCEVLFRNVRELPLSSLENTGQSWKLVIDFPFDEAGHGPRDDLSKIQQFKESHPDGAKTICWLPSFFSDEALKDLGRLVKIEYVLAGERFGQYSIHLSPTDRLAAKSNLENQRSVLRERVKGHLLAAYGQDALSPGSLDTVHELDPTEHCASLSPGFIPQPPFAADLAGAMLHLLGQALEHEFPAAPHFGTEIRPGTIKKVYDLVLPATQALDGRLLIEKTLRPLLRQVAEPLLLGEMGLDATHFLLGQHWKAHFTRKAAQTGATITVGQLRQWIDDPRPMGLPKEAENLLILLFAAQADYTFYRHGGPYEPTLQNIPDDCELWTVVLPNAGEWETATARAGSIFGVAASKLLNAANAGAFSAEVKKKASDKRAACLAYAQRLRERMACLGIAPDATNRLKTAAATRRLVDGLSNAEPGEVVHVLATANIATSEAAMGECFTKAAELEGNLDTAGWDIFEAIGKLKDERKAAAEEILAELRQAVSSDEHVLPLAPALTLAQAGAVRLLTKAAEPPPVPPVVPPPVAPPVQPPAQPPVPKGTRIVKQGSKEDLSLAGAEALVEDLGKQVKKGQSVRISVSWVIEEGGQS